MSSLEVSHTDIPLSCDFFIGSSVISIHVLKFVFASASDGGFENSNKMNILINHIYNHINTNITFNIKKYNNGNNSSYCNNNNSSNINYYTYYIIYINVTIYIYICIYYTYYI